MLNARMQAFREFAVSFRRQPQQMLPHRKVIYFQIVHFTPSIKKRGEVIVFYANGNCPQTKICKRLNHAGHRARHMKETDRRMPGRFFTSSLKTYIFNLKIASPAWRFISLGWRYRFCPARPPFRHIRRQCRKASGRRRHTVLSLQQKNKRCKISARLFHLNLDKVT